MIIYHDTEKELSLSDYIPLPGLSGLQLESLYELKDNLYDAYDNAYSYHSDFLCMALYPDIKKVELYIKKQERKAQRGTEK